MEKLFQLREPLTHEQIDRRGEWIADVLRRVNDSVNPPRSGEVVSALASLSRIVEQAKEQS